MRTRTRIRPAVAAAVALPVALAAVLLAGCGSTDHNVVVPIRATPSCGSQKVAPGSPGSPHAVCLAVGGTLSLELGTGERATETGAALKEVSPGVYRGARAGTAELGGFGRVCPSARSGAVACDAIAGWTITVDVR
jgi:hypothetical protein